MDPVTREMTSELPPIGRGRRRPTRESVLAVTKQLVAEKGPDGTTVRDITEASGANVAAVNYHFSSKDNLVNIALFEIHNAVNLVREERLNALEAAAAGGPIAPRDILRALIEPILDVSRSEDGGSLYVRTTYHMRTARYARLSQDQFHQFNAIARRFVMAICAAYPGMSVAQAAWQYEYARGAALHMLINLDPLWRRYEMLLIEPDQELPEEPSFVIDQAQIDRIIDTIMTGFPAA